MATPTEIELKLRLAPGATAALQRHWRFHGAPSERRREITTYYDTPDFDILEQGAALRVRRIQDRHIQTLKAERSAETVAAVRGEWEWELESDRPDLSRLAEAAQDDLAHTCDGKLQPVFVTEIDRTVHLLRSGDGVTIEAALDQGVISADHRIETVSELELELKDGDDILALYRLALDLLPTVGFSVVSDSKAARGYRLRRGEMPKAEPLSRLDLVEGMLACDAFGEIIGSALSHLSTSAVSAYVGVVEGTHQTRVALRRLRSTLLLFDPHLDEHTARLFESDMKRFGQILGGVRDWDVFVRETLPAVAADIPDIDWSTTIGTAVIEERQAADRRLRELLDGPEFTRTVLSMAAWIESGARHPRLLGDHGLKEKLSRIAPELLQRLARKVRKRGRKIAHLPDEKLHELRKSLKKLRYGTDALGSVFKPSPVRAYRKKCETLQELLGTLNDARMTIALADRLVRNGRPELAPLSDRLAAWSEARREEASTHLETAWSDFRSAEPFWR